MAPRKKNEPVVAETFDDGFDEDFDEFFEELEDEETNGPAFITDEGADDSVPVEDEDEDPENFEPGFGTDEDDAYNALVESAEPVKDEPVKDEPVSQKGLWDVAGIKYRHTTKHEVYALWLHDTFGVPYDVAAVGLILSQERVFLTSGGKEKVTEAVAARLELDEANRVFRRNNKAAIAAAKKAERLRKELAEAEAVAGDLNGKV